MTDCASSIFVFCILHHSVLVEILWYILLIDQNDMFGAVGTWLSDSLGTPPSVSARSLPKKERSMYSSADSVETHMWKCYLLSSLGEEQSPYIRCVQPWQDRLLFD